ncbi:InlB B-repeat-containing protein [Pelagicoccus albus]|uniref:Bacterial repeat domain-containing protein n=1 Tax=Pelagicoccus albus TaxID=415222 RepID=A0A7X1B9F5_9BACT|nr:hypothetical protein [Pelagicoccus albus]MBC2607997.1 hypothetical protein [Pelagicoccus albus]
MFRSLPLFFAAIWASLSYAELPDSAALEEALQFDGPNELAVELGDGAEVSLTESGLQLSVPADSYAKLILKNVPSPGEYLLSIETDLSGLGSTVQEFQGEEPSKSLYLSSYSYINNSFSFGSFFERDDETVPEQDISIQISPISSSASEASDRSFRFSNLEILQGTPLELVQTPGTTLSKYPDKDRYDYGEEVTLTASAPYEQVEFIRWIPNNFWGPVDGWDLESPELTIVPTVPYSFEAIWIIKQPFEGGFVECDLSDYNSYSLPEPGTAPSFSIDLQSNKYFRFTVENPGLFQMKVRRGNGVEANANWNSETIGEGETMVFSQWVSPATKDFSVPGSGNLELYDFEISPFLPIELTILGEGEVEGIVNESYVPLTVPHQLRAVPDEGWEFESWKGDVGSSDPVIEIDPNVENNFEARFYKVIRSGELELRSYSDHEWTITEGEDGLSLAPSNPLESWTDIARVGFLVEGSGLLSMQFDGYGSDIECYVDGVEVETSKVSGITTLELFLDRGWHAIVIAYDNSSKAFTYEPLTTVDNIKWQPGVPVEFYTTLGGTIEGYESGTYFLEGESATQLTAVPNDGYTFSHWSGLSESTQPSIEVSPSSPTVLKANFVKQADESGAIQSGDTLWTYSEGEWSVGNDMNEDQSAWFESTFIGPATMRIQVSQYGVSNFQYEIDGEICILSKEGVFGIPEGEHRVRVIAYGSVHSATRVRLEQVHPIDITLAGGSVEFSPALPEPDDYWEEDESDYIVYLPHGTELQITSTSYSDKNLFLGWDGDLAGNEATTQVLVDRPIVSHGRYGVETFEYNGIALETDTEGVFFNTDYLSLPSPWSSETATTLRTTLQGPGIFYLTISRVESASVYVDGEENDLSKSFSWASGKVLIEDGEHSVEIVVDPATSDSSSQTLLDPIVSSLGFTEGYQVSSGGAGGTVQMTPEETTYQLDASVQLLATADEGNTFVGWAAPYEASPNPLNLKVTEHASVAAIFASDGNFGGSQWSFENKPPSRLGSSDSEYLWYYFSAEDSGTQSSATTTLTGPVYASSYFYTYGKYDGLDVQLLLDGTAVEDVSGFLIPEGEHELRWEVTSLPLDESELSAISIYPLTLKESVSIYAFAYNAEIEISPAKSDYIPGEEVTLVASEKNLLGWEFYRWLNGSSNETFSTQRSITIEADPTYALQAEYRKDQLDIPNLKVIDEGYNDLWPSSQDIGPGQTEVFDLNVISTLLFEAETEGHIEFYVRSKYVDDIIEIEKEGQIVFKIQGSPLNWKHLRIPVSEGEQVKLIANRDDSYTYAQICGVKFLEYWAPMTQVTDPADLDFEPSLASLSKNSPVNVSVDENWEDDLIEWVVGEETQSAISQIEVSQADNTPITARINIPFDTQAGWAKPSSVGSFQQTSYASSWIQSSYGENEEASHTLTLPIEGPAYIRLSTESSHEDFIYKSGEQILNPIVLYENEIALQFPAGENALTIEHPFSPHESASIIFDGKDEGYRSYERVYEMGTMRFGTFTSTYQAGRSISVTALPKDGYEFVKWQAPYEEHGYQFQTDVSSEEPIPVFQKIINYETFLGHDWVLNNASLDVYSNEFVGTPLQTIEIDKLNYLEPIEMSTEIEGPAVIVFSDVDGSTEVPSYSIDNGDFQNAAYSNSGSGKFFASIQIPSGTHDLVLKYEDVPSYFNFGANIASGYLLDLTGIGTEIKREPTKNVYRTGDTVNIEAVPYASNTTLEWIGLPEELNADGGSHEIIIDGSLKLEVRAWKPAKLFGYDFQHAGIGTWTRLGAAEYTIAAHPRSNLDLLKLDHPDSGSYRFEFKSKERVSYWETVSPSITLLGGSSENTTAGQSLSSGRMIISEGTLGVIIENQVPDYNGTTKDQALSFDSLEKEELTGGLSDYLDWWLSFDESQGLDLGWTEPSGDPDEDGLTNYEEYLLGTDPGRPTPQIRLVPALSPEESLRLEIHQPSTSLLDDAKILFSTTLGTTWDYFELPESLDATDSADWKSTLLPPDLYGTDHLYFKLQHSAESRTLEELAE